MNLADFDYYLPNKLIASKPASPRDSSRFLVLNKYKATIQHEFFNQLPNFLKRGDVLVLNNTKVIPARLIGKKETGGKIEILLLHQIDDGLWEVLLNRKVKVGSKITITNNFWGEIISLPTKNLKWKIKFNIKNNNFKKYLNRYGEVPLPPYIKIKEQKNSRAKNKNSYQTVYANPNKEGSVAAPTAGLHFTKRLINRLKKKGIQFEYVTLYVGLGTFEPVRTKNVTKHKMHSELVEIDQSTLKNIAKAKKEERRIIAVGTTTARALESLPQKINTRSEYKKWVDIFIYPGYKFKHVDALITNFHLPKSTLLMMVSAFAETDLIKKAYQEAIKNRYRFYSYGDAMFIY